jgi:hypothetical protein
VIIFSIDILSHPMMVDIDIEIVVCLVEHIYPDFDMDFVVVGMDFVVVVVDSAIVVAVLVLVLFVGSSIDFAIEPAGLASHIGQLVDMGFVVVVFVVGKFVVDRFVVGELVALLVVLVLVFGIDCREIVACRHNSIDFELVQHYHRFDTNFVDIVVVQVVVDRFVVDMSVVDRFVVDR